MIQEFPCDERWTPMVGDEIFFGQNRRTIVDVNGDLILVNYNEIGFPDPIRHHVGVYYLSGTFVRRNVPDPVDPPPANPKEVNAALTAISEGCEWRIEDGCIIVENPSFNPIEGDNPFLVVELNYPDETATNPPSPTNAYLRTIKATNGPDRGKSVACDIYDIITAFSVTNVGQIQAVKKVLRGGRADKDWRRDIEEAILCLQRAIEIEGVK